LVLLENTQLEKKIFERVDNFFILYHIIKLSSQIFPIRDTKTNVFVTQNTIYNADLNNAIKLLDNY